MRAAMLDRLSKRCVKNQPAAWWALCVEVGGALMTHLPEVPGSYLTAAARLVAKSRGAEIQPLTHNAWVSATRMIFAELGTYRGRVEAITVQTHDRHVGLWRSMIYDPRAPRPDWWYAVMTEIRA